MTHIQVSIIIRPMFHMEHIHKWGEFRMKFIWPPLLIGSHHIYIWYIQLYCSHITLNPSMTWREGVVFGLVLVLLGGITQNFPTFSWGVMKVFLRCHFSYSRSVACWNINTRYSYCEMEFVCAVFGAIGVLVRYVLFCATAMTEWRQQVETSKNRVQTIIISIKRSPFEQSSVPETHLEQDNWTGAVTDMPYTRYLNGEWMKGLLL
jgi:hypothetical protein